MARILRQKATVTGTSFEGRCYGEDRDWFRSTRAHSTVTIDGLDQFRLWGAFRAGP